MKIVESVAGVLERELAPTIKEWLKQVNLIPELTKVKLTDANRTDHLPKLLNDVIFRLRLARDVEPLLSMAAAAHGRTRFEQGYSAAMLIEESRIFQVTTFGTLHLHQSKLDQSQVLLDVMTIADETDRQLTEAVRSLMAAKAAD
ncbi:MAG: response regulator receiver protein [Acidobacteriaceae bacterium]|nr:response regulator receiver protein [Acidobacteriaceae bacterium]